MGGATSRKEATRAGYLGNEHTSISESNICLNVWSWDMETYCTVSQKKNSKYTQQPPVTIPSLFQYSPILIYFVASLCFRYLPTTGRGRLAVSNRHVQSSGIPVSGPVLFKIFWYRYDLLQNRYIAVLVSVPENRYGKTG